MRGTYSGVNSPNATITQSAATESTYYEYSISLSPTSASFSATGESKSFTVTSQRKLVTGNSVFGITYGNWGDTSWEISSTNLGMVIGQLVIIHQVQTQSLLRSCYLLTDFDERQTAEACGGRNTDENSRSKRQGFKC